MAVHTAMRRGRRLTVGVALAALAVAGGCSDDDATADFCEKYRSYEDANEDLGLDNAQNPEDVDLEDVKDQFSTISDQLDELADSAPEDISDDVDTVRSKFGEVADAVQSAESPEDLTEATSGVVDDEEATEASQRVEDWVADNCDSDGAK